MVEEATRVLLVSGTGLDHADACEVAMMLGDLGSVVVLRDDLWREPEICRSYRYQEPMPVVTIDMREPSDWAETAHLRRSASSIPHFETPKPLTKRARRRLKGRSA
jgi:hypothetical protein